MVRIFSAILKRTLQLAVLCLLVASATFVLASLIPGDFFSARESDPNTRRQTIDIERQRNGLDQPLLVQYERWLARCVRLDLGQSLFYQSPVREVVLDAGFKTLWISVPALVLGILGGILLGAIHAIHRYDSIGLAMELFSAIALALPSLVLGLAALLFAAATHWFPLGSVGSFDVQNMNLLAQLGDRIHHLILPVACLTVPVLVYVEKMQCAATLETLGEPYVRAAHARGLSRYRVLSQYLLRPALTPVLSTLGPLLGSVLSGSLVLEVIFGWPGLGQVTLNGLLRMDLPLVIGCVVSSTILLVFGNLFADILLLALDPRTRLAERLL